MNDQKLDIIFDIVEKKDILEQIEEDIHFLEENGLTEKSSLTVKSIIRRGFGNIVEHFISNIDADEILDLLVQKQESLQNQLKELLDQLQVVDPKPDNSPTLDDASNIRYVSDISKQLNVSDSRFVKIKIGDTVEVKDEDIEEYDTYYPERENKNEILPNNEKTTFED